MPPASIFTVFVASLVIGAVTNAVAGNEAMDPAPQPKTDSQLKRSPVLASRTSSATRLCRADEDTFRTLRLTTFEDGVRVEHEFVRAGRATWTDMNRPLLKQLGIRAAGTFCLPREIRLADENDD